VLALTQSLCKARPSVASTPIVIDAKHGSVSEVWRALISELNIASYSILHEAPLPDFGGIETNPTKYETLTPLRTLQTKYKAPIAFANDPDGDRHVILDENGQALTPEETTIIITDFLAKLQQPLYGVATTVASSRLIKSACASLGINVDETAVGFKFFAPFFSAARHARKIGLGVESSGGFSISSHTMEKCGFLPCILMLYIMCITQKTISELKEAIYATYGRSVFMESEFHFDASKKDTLARFFQTCTKDDVQPHFSRPIHAINRADGLKLILDQDDWILLRLSGTEPVARIYTEADKHETSQALLETATTLLTHQCA